MYCFGPPLSLCTGLLQKLSTYNGKFSRMRQSRNFHVAFLLGSQFSGPIFRKLWQASHYFLKRRTPHPSMRTHRHTRACALTFAPRSPSHSRSRYHYYSYYHYYMYAYSHSLSHSHSPSFSLPLSLSLSLSLSPSPSLALPPAVPEGHSTRLKDLVRMSFVMSKAWW